MFHRKEQFSLINVILFGLLLVAAVFNFTLFSISFFKARKIIETRQPARLKVVYIQPKDCPDCFDLSQIVNTLRQMNVKIAAEKYIEFDDQESKELIKKHNILYVPTLIIGGEIYKNKDLSSVWKMAGKVEEGVFILERVLPPYVEVKTGEVRGRFNLTYLSDLSCAECYDVARHEIALDNLGMKPYEDKVVDVSSEEGRKLINDYDIQFVPAILLKGDLEVYENFNNVWRAVGSVEGDGMYVFREGGQKIMGAYKNIQTGEIFQNASP